MQRENYFAAAAIPLFMGFIFAGIAAFVFYQEYALERDGVRVEGVVITQITMQDDDGSTLYTPVVRFTSPGGREFTF